MKKTGGSSLSGHHIADSVTRHRRQLLRCIITELLGVTVCCVTPDCDCTVGERLQLRDGDLQRAAAAARPGTESADGSVGGAGTR